MDGELRVRGRSCCVDVTVHGREADPEGVRVRIASGRVHGVGPAVCDAADVLQEVVEMALDGGLHSLSVERFDAEGLRLREVR